MMTNAMDQMTKAFQSPSLEVRFTYIRLWVSLANDACIVHDYKRHLQMKLFMWHRRGLELWPGCAVMQLPLS